MQLTPEQQQIVASGESRIVVRAGAGTGKTATLIEYAKARPDKKLLYLAFNKSIAEEAREKFPKNVEVRTTHSLAFGEFGRTYKHKLGELRPYHMEKVFGSDVEAEFALRVMDLVKRFLQSQHETFEDVFVEVISEKGEAARDKAKNSRGGSKPPRKFGRP